MIRCPIRTLRLIKYGLCSFVIIVECYEPDICFLNYVCKLVLRIESLYLLLQFIVELLISLVLNIVCLTI